MDVRVDTQENRWIRYTYQRVSAPRARIAGSEVITGILSRSDCATSIRSKGSRCWPAMVPAFMACFHEIRSSRKLSVSSLSSHEAIILSARGNFPILYFVATSQADAELTQNTFTGSWNIERQRADKLSGSAHHHKSVQVSRSMLIFPKLGFLLQAGDQRIPRGFFPDTAPAPGSSVPPGVRAAPKAFPP